MGAGSRGAGSGILIGLGSVVMGQQLGLVDLSSTSLGVTYLVVVAVIGALFFGLIGKALGRRSVYKHTPVTEWKAEPEPQPALPETMEPPPPAAP
jgi:hypothetical protein